jgi:GNAT superfamily N-acetyltransferase
VPTAPSFPIRIGLDDGLEALVRPVRPSDKILLEIGLEALSRESRYRRFLSPIREFTESQLAYLTEVDGVNHVALLAAVRVEGAHVGGGVARYVRDPDEPDTAEFALTVTDDMQNKGLGTRLTELLIEVARANGYRTLVGLVQRDNRPMLAVLEKLGATTRPDGELLKAEIDLEA